MPAKAVIFDLDGTVLANEAAYGAAFKFVLSNLGIKVNQIYPQTIGLGLKDNWTDLLNKYHIKTDQSLEELTQATQNYYLKHLSLVHLNDGLMELLAQLKDEDWQVALATSNHWWLVEKELEEFYLDTQFDTITTAEEVTELKPAPDIYLETAKKLGVDPVSCAVIENSTIGIQSAKAADMTVIAILSDFHTEKDLKTAGASLVIKSFSEVSPHLLTALMPPSPLLSKT